MTTVWVVLRDTRKGVEVLDIVKGDVEPSREQVARTYGIRESDIVAIEGPFEFPSSTPPSG